MNKLVLKIFILCLTFIELNICIYAQDRNIPIPPAPNPVLAVNDLANILTDEQELMLRNKLKKFYDSTSNQITIVTVNDLGGYEVEDYAYALGKIWGIGKADKDNGILILTSMNPKKIRIEVGRGLEGAVPDITAYSIIEKSMKPNFRSNNFFAGFDNALEDIFAASRHEYVADPNQNAPEQKGGGLASLLFALFILFLFFYIANRNNKNRAYYMSRRGQRQWDNNPWVGGGPFIGGPFIGGGFDSHDSGSGSFGGDFGGGFGGGDFGGGGASGDW